MWSLDGVHCTFFVFPFVVSNHLGMVVWIIFGRLGFFGFDLRVYMPWIDRGVFVF
jgi:hypothetical protein